MEPVANRLYTCRTLRLREALRYFIPVYDVPERRYVIGAAVLILQVIGMFPHVHTEDRNALRFGDVHERVVLVGSRSDDELAVLSDEPCPSRAEAGDAGVRECLFEFVEGNEVAVDRCGEIPRRRAAPLGFIHCQKAEWFQCPQPLLRTAAGSFEMFARISSSDFDAHSPPSTALFRFVTYAL